MCSPRPSRTCRAMTTSSCCATSTWRAHCEHHMAPFLGKAYVAYMPTENGRRHLQARPRGRDLRQAPADAGDDDLADRQRDQRRADAPRRRRPDRRQAPVHDHARRPPPGRLDHHHPVHRRLQDRPRTARALPADGAPRPRGCDGVDSTGAIGRSSRLHRRACKLEWCEAAGAASTPYRDDGRA